MTLNSELSIAFRQLLDANADAMLVMDAGGIVVALSPKAEQLLGWTEGELLGTPMNRVLPQGIKDTTRLNQSSSNDHSGAAPGAEPVRLSARRKDGSEFAAEFTHVALASGEDALVLVTIRDPGRWRGRPLDTCFRGYEQASNTLASLGDAVIVTDLDETITYLNPKAEQLTGWHASEALGRPLLEVLPLVHESTRLPVESVAARCLDAGHAVKLPDGVVLLHRDGSEVAIEDSAAPLRDGNGTTTGVVLVFRDVTERRLETRRLSHEATHDSLTGLISRQEFEHRLARVTEPASELSHHVLCYLDLDRFKAVNDTCGHEAGDRLLRTIGDLLASRLRSRDTVGRLGGDEFGILLEHCSVEKAKGIAIDLVSAIEDLRYVWGKRSFSLGASVGVVPITASYRLPADVLRAADHACYAAKKAGGNRVHLVQEPDVGACEPVESDTMLA